MSTPLSLLVTPARYISREALAPYTGGKPYSAFHLRRLESEGKFPKRKYLTPQRPVWDVDELNLWFAQRIAESTK